MFELLISYEDIDRESLLLLTFLKDRTALAILNQSIQVYIQSHLITFVDLFQ